MNFRTDLKESLSMALNAVRVNKLRSSLTLLGVAVGVFSIIAVMTATRVLQNSIESGLTVLGTHTFQVQRMPIVMVGGPGHWLKYRNRKNIKLEHGLKVAESATLAQSVGLEMWEHGKIVKYKGAATNPNVSLAGENPEGFLTNNWIIKEGRAINEEDYQLAREVAVIGEDVRQKLFPQIDPIGENIIIDGQRYTVIGYLQKKGEVFGSAVDNFVAIPLTTFIKYYGKERRDVHIMVKAKSQDVYEDAIEEVRLILRTVRKVPPGEEDDFAIFSNDSLIKQWNELTFYLKVGVGFISFIALLAAGVGIMNIMLVSVTERTREIGIRKAVGATKKTIMTQFITEAVILCQIGGLVGVFLGILGGNLAALALEIPPAVPYDWALIGLLVCSVVGIIFGTYPAWKAANLDPVESLRYE